MRFYCQPLFSVWVGKVWVGGVWVGRKGECFGQGFEAIEATGDVTDYGDGVGWRGLGGGYYDTAGEVGFGFLWGEGGGGTVFEGTVENAFGPVEEGLELLGAGMGWEGDSEATGLIAPEPSCGECIEFSGKDELIWSEGLFLGGRGGSGCLGV